ncbi:iron ABC transporter permease [Aquabacterium sp.]|uniref:FecCD family ABC transporter permease n=1 Tax=Aquabacterium sp. TaxID=1872578 RepID=UPI002489686F|nr:iron ABC transporter permease [Aquabacterium sp.]MDI1261540.1 iron ABC transporter permease [Aquabacterium sp.]
MSATAVMSKQASLTGPSVEEASSVWSRTPRMAMAIVMVGLLCTAIVASTKGAVQASLDDWQAGLNWLGALGAEPLSGAGHVLWQIRMPRILLAMLIGASLALAGGLAQGLFRNPLADPGLLGVSSGAACATALSLVFFSSMASVPMPVEWRPYLTPLAAFVGALTVCLVLDSLARWLTPGSIAGLLLTGLAINAVAGAVIGLATYMANDEQLRSLSFWTLGSVAGASWTAVGLLAAILLPVIGLARHLARPLNALALGEAAANHVGIDLHALRLKTVVLVALSCGAAVAWCGMIGFIGLLAPHLARTWTGPDHRTMLPLAMGIGAWLLLMADTLARTLAIPAEIPVGIFTALLGGPLLIVMLHSMSKRQGHAV